MTYATTTPALGGRIKHRVSDFVVEEMHGDGVCQISAFAQGKEKRELQKEWPENAENREHLVLEFEKFDYDLNMAVRMMAHWVHASRKRVGYAGLKDKRGITCQRISIWKPEYERVQSFLSRFIDLRFFAWSDKRVEIGDLVGNRFTITVRDIDKSEGEIRQIIGDFFEQAKSTGVANFFGEQRFGGIRDVTHRVGRCVLAGDLEKAVMTYLCHDAGREADDVREVRRQLEESRDFYAALRAFPRKYRFERAMCQHLHKNPGDFAGALGALPKNMRFLFTHALQAKLFNKMLEKRLELGLGFEAQEGERVIDGIPAMQLVGFESAFSEGVIGEIERAVMAEEGLSFSDFECHKMRELSSKGAWKKVALRVQEPELLEIGEDAFHEGKRFARVRFSLEKGAYATTVMAELTKRDA